MATTMSAPVDVLAVMDDAQCDAEQFFGAESRTVAALIEARAAVAELIEAANSALRRAEFEQGADAGNDGMVRHLRAAIARVGAAP